MITRHGPEDPSRSGLPAPVPEPAGMTGRLREERRRRTEHDTLADDCAEGFLAELDEALWMREEVQRAAEHAFRHAARKADHIETFRRVLYRLHLVLTDWEESALGNG